MKRPSCKAGLKEGPKKKKEKTGEAEGEGKAEEPEKHTKEEGLQEGQPKKETENPKTPPHTEEASESGFSLTSHRLKFHEETQKAIQGLKEGQLSEDEFGTNFAKMKRQLCGRSLSARETKALKRGRPGLRWRAKE